jgi:hypothetical protein
MSFQTSRDGTAASARAIASPNGIPFMYNSGDNTTAPSNETKITASDAAANDNYGRGVAVGSGRVVVGAERKLSYTGAAYIYDLDGTLITKITASDGATGDGYGGAVAVGSGRIAVGSDSDDDNNKFNSGSVYIYDLNGNLITKITASDPNTNDEFGRSVAVGSGRIVVGALFDDDGGTNTGSAYIFDLEGNQIAKITASDGAGNDFFGGQVAVGSGRIVVGAFGDDDNGSSSGSAYIFDLNGAQIAKITASDGAAGDLFGRAVAVASGRIVVGAPQDAAPSSLSGSAYIFDLEGNQIAKITASDGAGNEYFGQAVAVGCGRIVVGAYDDDDIGYNNSGSVFIFDLDGNEIAKLTASDRASVDNFGDRVAIGSGRIVVGAYNDDDGGSASGSAYIYETPNVITPYDVRDWEYG